VKNYQSTGGGGKTYNNIIFKCGDMLIQQCHSRQRTDHRIRLYKY